jgi:hypothetical protein
MKDDLKEYKKMYKQTRVGTISGDLAEKLQQALDDSGVIIYQRVGPRLVDIYVEALKK